MVKSLKIFFFGTSGPISINFNMLHRGPWLIILCSHYDPGMTLTYFTARSIFATYAFIQEKATYWKFLQYVAWKLVGIVNLMSK